MTDMPTVLHIGCGTDIHEDAHNVDKMDLEGVDQAIDLNEYPWDLPRDHFEEIRAYHVLEHLSEIGTALRECQQLLVDGGKLVVKVPVGQNAIADPDHEHVWIWDTPLYYCGERHWDTDVGLKVVDRDVDVHIHIPDGSIPRRLYEWGVEYAERSYGQGRWMFDLPFTSGEFTVVFEK